MRTISPAFYEKMAEAKQTFCAYCMCGAMPFLEPCEECKIHKMFQAVRAVINQERAAEDREKIEPVRSTYDGIDLPGELIAGIGTGPDTEDGFHASPKFIIHDPDTQYEAFQVQLVEAKTGFPDFAGSDDLPPSRSRLYHLCIYRDAPGDMNRGSQQSTIEIWETTYDGVAQALKGPIKDYLGDDVNWLWGIDRLSYIDQHLLVYSKWDKLAQDLLDELDAMPKQEEDEYGCLTTASHFLAMPRQTEGLRYAYEIWNVHVALCRQRGLNAVRYFLKVRCTIPPSFLDMREVRGTDATAVRAALKSLLLYFAGREDYKNCRTVPQASKSGGPLEACG